MIVDRDGMEATPTAGVKAEGQRTRLIAALDRVIVGLAAALLMTLSLPVATLWTAQTEAEAASTTTAPSIRHVPAAPAPSVAHRTMTA